MTKIDQIIALSKRRGFIYPSSEIYGGFANAYTYGPYGSLLKKNIKDLWWAMFVEQRTDMVGIDGPILLHPKTWQASGHVETFNDPMVDCRHCNARHRADHLVETKLNDSADGWSLEKLGEFIVKEGIKCPKCGEKNFTDARQFNLMFQTQMAKTGEDSMAYLRPETAQAIFTEFKNITDTMRVKIPFGVGQIGKAFRNEITPGNFIFRVLEFEQMEIEYFIHPDEWETHFEAWVQAIYQWCELIGLERSKIHELEVTGEALAHYSKKTIDLEYEFPFGVKELYGCAYRTDFDLQNHERASGRKLKWRDPQTNQEYTPHVIEPTFGVDRTILALLSEAYTEEALEGDSTRTVLQFKPAIAPVKVAVLPLMKKDGLPEKAQTVLRLVQKFGNCEYDQSGNVGKRYRRQDEIGTPVCVTIDYESLDDECVTVRDRDTMLQERIKIEELVMHLENKYFRQCLFLLSRLLFVRLLCGLFLSSFNGFVGPEITKYSKGECNQNKRYV